MLWGGKVNKSLSSNLCPLSGERTNLSDYICRHIILLPPWSPHACSPPHLVFLMSHPPFSSRVCLSVLASSTRTLGTLSFAKVSRCGIRCTANCSMGRQSSSMTVWGRQTAASHRPVSPPNQNTGER